MSEAPRHAPWAADPTTSRGRLHDEQRETVRGPRDAFQRDRDRIIHSISFRRLRHKTQVFMAPDGDHFRVRLTHSLEVAQIGRTVARTLGLNEDLTEALCLAHDIGHPPFGHAGEDALQAALTGQGGFDHNGQQLRALMVIDSPSSALERAEPDLGDAGRAGQAQWPDRRAAMGAGRGRCRVSARPDALAVAGGAGRGHRRRHRL